MCFLEGVIHQSVDTLSKGYRHRTCFAQSIIHDPDVLVLDEPTDGLDPNQKHEVRGLIRRMGEKKAIIFSTHILEETLACGVTTARDMGGADAGFREAIAEGFIKGPRLLIFRPGDRITVNATKPTRMMFLGGDALEGPRHIWWNFVSSSQERIEQAKQDWKTGRFAAVPQEHEFIPLPE